MKQPSDAHRHYLRSSSVLLHILQNRKDGFLRQVGVTCFQTLDLRFYGHVTFLVYSHSPEAFNILDIKEIKILIELMKKNDLSVFRMESEGFKIVLKKNSGYAPAVSALPQQASVPVSAQAAGIEAPAATGKEIVSPMVGTFYTAPSPESPPYVKVGQDVTPDTVVCIIEAMKVMNEIKAEIAGKITEVLVENGKPVQYGQALFRLK